MHVHSPDSPELQGAEGEECAQYPNDPEPHHNLGFRPALHLEVVMQGCAQKYPVRSRVIDSVPSLAVLEDVPLQNHRYHFRHEQSANEDEQE
jgi:hypothetical protein